MASLEDFADFDARDLGLAAAGSSSSSSACGCVVRPALSERGGHGEGHGEPREGRDA